MGSDALLQIAGRRGVDMGCAANEMRKGNERKAILSSVLLDSQCANKQQSTNEAGAMVA